MKQNTSKLVPLWGDEAETQHIQAVKSFGMGTCSWVNSMLRSSNVMLIAHHKFMGDFQVLGLVQEDKEWVKVRILTKTGEEGTIVLPWYTEFSLFLGRP